MKLTTRLLKEMIQQELLEMEKGDKPDKSDKTEYYKKVEGSEKPVQVSKDTFDDLVAKKTKKETYAGNPGPVGIKTKVDHIEMVEISKEEDENSRT